MLKTKSTILTKRASEKGVALAIAIIIMAIVMAISIGILTVANAETGISAADVRRTQTFYAAASSVEHMTNNFSDLYSRKARATTADLTAISDDVPAGLTGEGFSFNQKITQDTKRLKELRFKQFGNENDPRYPYVTIPPGTSLEGLYGSITPYLIESTASQIATGTKVTVQREMNNYQVPLFQFGIFGNNDVEFHPGPKFTFNGRVHSNRNLYLAGNDLILEDKVTCGNEIVHDVDRNGNTDRARNVKIKVGSGFQLLADGSVVNGPNFFSGTLPSPAPTPLPRGYFPDSPNGTDNTGWPTNSIDTFKRQVLTRSTKASTLNLPLQLDGAPTRELIKRPMPGDEENLRESRYYNKAIVRILIDDENTGVNAAGIPATKGVALSEFTPIALPINNANGLKNALLPVSGNNYDASLALIQLQQQAPGFSAATIVRQIQNKSTLPGGVPAGEANGAGIKGRILIEVVVSHNPLTGAEVTKDVTTEILSMGMTVGEPNAIVHLQRPLWAAFVPGSRTRNSGSNLADLINSTNAVNDGELANPGTNFDSNLSFITSIQDDDSGLHYRNQAPDTAANPFNDIVPINMYNVREGWSEGFPGSNKNKVTERGMTSVVEINMRNLSRWLAGYYDVNLLAGTNAVSSNMISDEGYTVYVSDRRGDKPKNEYVKYNVNGAPIGAAQRTTNGIVDNEDIYSTSFNSAVLEEGEDVIDFGVDPDTGYSYKARLQNDLTELPLPYVDRTDGSGKTFPVLQNGDVTSRRNNAMGIFRWKNDRTADRGYFRRAVRLFNGEDLNPNFNVQRLSTEMGITIAAENMVYIWGSYNASGINWTLSGSSTKNEPNSGGINGFAGDQVPASIVCDAFFPLSRTWFDGLSAMFPEDSAKRIADSDLPSAQNVTRFNQETTVRAAIIAGTTMSAKRSGPDQYTSTASASGGDNESRMSGGVHNFPRFMEKWSGNTRWNYTGSLILLYYSTQAVGPYNQKGVIYDAPERNWSFDVTYKDPNRLPPGTPFFQFINPTGFRQLISSNASASPTP